MTEAQKIQKEIDEFNAKRLAEKKALMVECDAPELKKSFSYRPSSWV